MLELKIKVCDNWDGAEKTCDRERCSAILAANNMLCYHKPFELNGQLTTLANTVRTIKDETRKGNLVAINGKPCNLQEALDYAIQSIGSPQDEDGYETS